MSISWHKINKWTPTYIPYTSDRYLLYIPLYSVFFSPKGCMHVIDLWFALLQGGKEILALCSLFPLLFKFLSLSPNYKGVWSSYTVHVATGMFHRTMFWHLSLGGCPLRSSHGVCVEISELVHEAEFTSCGKESQTISEWIKKKKRPGNLYYGDFYILWLIEILFEPWFPFYICMQISASHWWQTALK